MKKSWLLSLGVASTLLLGACTTEAPEKQDVSKLEQEDVQVGEDGTITGNDKASILKNIDLKQMYGDDEKVLAFAEKFFQKKAPDFEMSTLSGEKVSLKDYEGKPVVLKFASSSCSVCQSSQYDFATFKNESGVDILQLFPFDNNASVEKFLTQTATHEIVERSKVLTNETTNTVAKDYEVPFTPFYFFIDDSGHVAYIHVGAIDHANLQNLLEFIYS